MIRIRKEKRIGEAYLEQIEKEGAPVNVTAREFDLTGTSSPPHLNVCMV